jgi:hypothetical protein
VYVCDEPMQMLLEGLVTVTVTAPFEDCVTAATGPAGVLIGSQEPAVGIPVTSK